ncbi:MAG: hypothetical protein R3C41_03975 [Calditrichia bacterium]
MSFLRWAAALLRRTIYQFLAFSRPLEYSNVKNTFTLEIPGMEQTTEDVSKTLSPGVQQLNVFMMKELAGQHWVNFEMVNSFSTERGWGEFNLEAWVKYRKTAFQPESGIFIPVLTT